MAGVARKEIGTPLNTHADERRRLLVNGIVQGVGFRPFVYRIAVGFGLKGFIRNTPSGVLIEIQGSPELLDSFGCALQSDRPPLARLETIEKSTIDCVTEDGFVIGDSSAGDEVETLIPPDIALCSDCRRELLDPANRRFRYPFINCTNCGPRYTIVGRLPYDRPSTSMHSFVMCPECEREYHNPLDRRFHAQPNACSVCGPALVLHDAAGAVYIPPLGRSGLVQKMDVDAVAEAVKLLKEGMILALKGLGGFHLAVDARNDAAVQRLRVRKGREAKPFAVMMRDMTAVQSICKVSEGERNALASPEAPIVLLKKKMTSMLAASVAPGYDRLGVMLPYTPLHTLLFEDALDALVMTSANFSEEPIVHGNDEALSRLAGIADAFLLHNRSIYLKCDDSVTIFLAGELRQIRRSRGYVPAPISLREAGVSVLGTGGELKNTVTLLKGAHALTSQHIGDMKNFEAYRHFQHVVAHLQHLFQAIPELVVHDLHPGYMTTQWAQQQHIPTLGVQHHHAHLVACLAENRVEGPAIGLILDGTGYGTDGTIWGGEVLIGDASGVQRFASLESMPLQGGDVAVMQPWRLALCYLHRSCADIADLPFMKGRNVLQILELLGKNINIVETSSCGRLFDAVAALCNLRGEITYEGEAAIALMHAAKGVVGDKCFPYALHFEGDEAASRKFPRTVSEAIGNNNVRNKGEERWIIRVSPMIQEIVSVLLQGMSVREISQRFHRTMITCFCEIIEKASEVTGITTVALSGGVFQNELLFETMHQELQRSGYQVLTHRQVPSNDGGISLGQAIIGRNFLSGRYAR
ncbi:MAG: carbamoyltransferase HypF [Chlorobium sp.]|nr:MAG: carbamoyltransferase HypF [Chlorobium sp.]